MIDLVSEQPDFYVYYKPPGMDFHTHQGVPGFFKNVESLHPREKLFPVHRLDKITSGLILLARSSPAEKELSRLFHEKGLEKYYLAMSNRKPARKKGLIKGDMQRSRRGAWKLARTLENPAATYFYSRSVSSGLRLFLLRIYTGKTHQIRVAMKSLGSPVLGDPLYYASGPESDRTYLHAWVMRFFWKSHLLEFRCDPREGRLFRPDEGFLLPPDWERPEKLFWPDFRG